MSVAIEGDMNRNNCKHTRTRIMTWPDNGQSYLCTDCLLTRHEWEQGTTEWQDHKYKTPEDWYLEAAKLQRQINIL